MPRINEKGEIGYFEWESKIDYEWLGLSRSGLTGTAECRGPIAQPFIYAVNQDPPDDEDPEPEDETLP